MGKEHPEHLRELAIKLAWSCIGAHYSWGGQNPLRGLDCSGLIVWIFRTLGIFAPDEDYAAAGLWKLYQKSRIESAGPGVLVFYGKTQVTHVAICVDYEYCICASGGDSSVKTIEDARKRGAYVKLKRIRYRKDIRGFVDPFRGN